MDYKAADTRKITAYINLKFGDILVEDIIRYSGADKLRVYPALFELEQSGFLEVVEREELGAAVGSASGERMFSKWSVTVCNTIKSDK